jgi:TPP-dependent 2-oxoacid decarboxylase
MIITVQKARLLLHHTMEPGMDQTIYVGMAEPIRKTHTILTDEKAMAQEIDRVIEAGVKSRLPVYIYVPLDVVGVQLDESRLDTPLNTKVVNSNSGLEDEVVQSTLELIKRSSKPSILADVLTIRHGGQELARRLASTTQFPTYATPLSKGVFDETSSTYNGVYNGEGNEKPSALEDDVLTRSNLVSFPGCADSLESSDLVLDIGFLLSDSNTGGFTRNIPDDKLVLLGHDYCQIHNKKFEDVHFLPVLKRVVEEIEKDPKQFGLPRTESRTKVEVKDRSNHSSCNFANNESDTTSKHLNIRINNPILHLATHRPFPASQRHHPGRIRHRPIRPNRRHLPPLHTPHNANLLVFHRLHSRRLSRRLRRCQRTPFPRTSNFSRRRWIVADDGAGNWELY